MPKKDLLLILIFLFILRIRVGKNNNGWLCKNKEAKARSRLFNFRLQDMCHEVDNCVNSERQTYITVIKKCDVSEIRNVPTYTTF